MPDVKRENEIIQYCTVHTYIVAWPGHDDWASIRNLVANGYLEPVKHGGPLGSETRFRLVTPDRRGRID